MPNLKSVIAGLAISTAVTGGVVGLGAAATTTSAGAAAQVSTGTSVLTGGGCQGWRRCGWGWRRGHHNRQRLIINIHNRNFNRNDRFDNERRHERRLDRDNERFEFKPEFVEEEKEKKKEWPTLMVPETPEPEVAEVPEQPEQPIWW
ncbi:hypothetical protein [Nonomuraea jiangxiensis]|uniref:Uncharacterized protein n=1 Tax=Nonomuraea jiangxiensis TaxID=633440 RepID=A0A1G8N957_9ACTN|nr:hypothetical protein [Nonomuraea jiangxiensis]SDI76829.1 hypothetical protein SAMN05421869_10756 [Nonomuraea jiangxiensis]